MELKDAESLLDGGTTSLKVVEKGIAKFITIDYSLPMDGRPRYIYLGKTLFSRGKQLEINSEGEKKIVFWVKDQLISLFGEYQLEEFLAGRAANLTREAKWLFALNFYRILSLERDYFK
ncbi:hypothetical protein CEE45_08535 [Candidatus Heimdallarchaeota archaeon B3_Heim]|nr:MAG: hypothetical protein CEE45_08535 [Candidatus Heimdallarchaeota archaeon B3_Heim]